MATKNEIGSSHDHALLENQKPDLPDYGGTPISTGIVSQPQKDVKRKFSRSQIYAIATEKETGSSRDHVLQNYLKNAVSAYGGTPISDKIVSQSSENVNRKRSDRDPDFVRQNKSLAKQNEKLQEDVSYLREMLKLQKQTTDGKLFTRSSVESAARYLKKQGGVRGDTQELAGEWSSSKHSLTCGTRAA